MTDLQIHPEQLSPSDQLQLEKINQLIKTFTSIIQSSGFSGEEEINPLNKQVRFQRQLGLSNGLLDISVQVGTNQNEPWHNAIVEYRSLNSQMSPLIRNMPIKQVITQISSSKSEELDMANYRECKMQITLFQPLSYQHEDFIYQVRIEPLPKPRILLGISWIKPEMQISVDEAVQILNQISSYMSPT